MSKTAWFRCSDATTSSLWITAGSIWGPALAGLSKQWARHCVTCRNIRPTSIPSRCLTANSRHSCVKWQREPSQALTAPSAPSSRRSVLKNVPTISGMQAMFQYDRNPLLARAAEALGHAQEAVAIRDMIQRPATVVEADWLHFLEARQTRYRQLDGNLGGRRQPYGVGDDP